MAIVVELASRGHKSSGFYTFDGPSVRIGRAYDNDLILDEIHVSAYHAQLRCDDDGCWWLHDMDSNNGLTNRRHQRKDSPLRIESGDDVWIGKVHLRFFNPHHPVEEAISLSATETVLYSLTSPMLAFFMVLCAIALLTGIEWQHSFKPFQWKEFLPQAIGLPVAAILWASVWSGIGRLQKHDSRFVAQIIISFVYLILAQLWIGVSAIVAFNSSSFIFYRVLLYVGGGLLFALLLSFNMRLATPMAARHRFYYANGIACLLVIIVVVMGEYGTRERFGNPKYVNAMFPPVTRFTPSMSAAQFEDDSVNIFNFPTEK